MHLLPVHPTVRVRLDASVLLLLLVGALVAVLASTGSAFARGIVQPSVIATDTVPLSGTDVNSIADQSGLTPTYTSGSDDFDIYVAGAVFDPFLNGEAGYHQFTPAVGGSFDFDLGETTTIDRFALWQFPNNGGELATVSLIADDEPSFSGATVLGSFSLAFDSGSTSIAQSFTFAPTDARYVRLTVDANHGFGAASVIGEVAFGSPPPVVDSRSAQQVAGTLNIQWELISAPVPDQLGCRGIEITDGTLADAADGSITMAGTAVSNDNCIGLDSYSFTMAPDGLSLSGFAGIIPMTLTRSPGDAAFAGYWIDQGYVYLAHIAADPFPVPDFNPRVEGEWIGWFERTPDLEMGTARLLINDPSFDGTAWTFDGLIEWDCLFDEECSASELVTGVVSASGAVQLSGNALVDSTNWALGDYSGQMSDDRRTITGTLDGGTWSLTRVSAFAVPTEVTTIQGAVDSFSDRPGLRIEIEPGTYVENVDLGALAANPGAVDITGIGSADQVVIDDGDAPPGPAIVATSGAGSQYPLHLRNLTIAGGNVFAVSSSQGGAGLRVDGGTRQLVVESCVIRDNYHVNRSDFPSAFGSGASVHPSCRARFVSCSIRDNAAVPGPINGSRTYNSFAGGISAFDGASVEVIASEITGNDANYGSGMWVYGSDLRVVDSDVHDNNPSGIGRNGGGIFVNVTTAEIVRTTFRGNRVVSVDFSTGFGGGLGTFNATVRLVDVIFESNEAGRIGGGLYTSNGGTTEIIRGRFGGPGDLGNAAFNASPVTTRGGAIFFDSASSLTIDGTYFEGNTAKQGGAILFSGLGGGRTMFVKNARFVRNEAQLGAAIVATANGILTVVDSDFEANVASIVGGALWYEGFSGTLPTSVVNNSRFYRNRTLGPAAGAIGVDAQDFPLQIVGCSIVENSAEGTDATGGGLGIYAGSIEIANSILWGNTGVVGTLEQQQVAVNQGAAVDVAYALVQGADPLTTLLGPGPVLTDDPQFVDAANGDLRLVPGSPAIDAGDASRIPAGQVTDLDGNPRVFGPNVDLGPYESQIVAVSVDDGGPASLRRGNKIDSAAPNPFNPRVTISFRVAQDGLADVSVYDLRGRLVRVLTKGNLRAGDHSVTWSGTDASGRTVATGNYIVRLRAGDDHDTRTITLLK